MRKQQFPPRMCVYVCLVFFFALWQEIRSLRVLLLFGIWMTRWYTRRLPPFSFFILLIPFLGKHTYVVCIYACVYVSVNILFCVLRFIIIYVLVHMSIINMICMYGCVYWIFFWETCTCYVCHHQHDMYVWMRVLIFFLRDMYLLCLP